MSKENSTPENNKKRNRVNDSQIEINSLKEQIAALQAQLITALQDQQTIVVKIKKLSPDAQIPTYVTIGSAGLDIVATDQEFDRETNCQVYHTGLAVEIPKGYVGLLFPKSNITRHTVSLANCVGVIDSDYRGEIIAKFKADTQHVLDNIKCSSKLLSWLFRKMPTRKCPYGINTSVVQMIILPYPKVNFVEVEELTPTLRSDKGFGEMDVTAELAV